MALLTLIQILLNLRWLHDLTQLEEEGKKLSDKVGNSNTVLLLPGFWFFRSALEGPVPCSLHGIFLTMKGRILHQWVKGGRKVSEIEKSLQC